MTACRVRLPVAMDASGVLGDKGSLLGGVVAMWRSSAAAAATKSLCWQGDLQKQSANAWHTCAVPQMLPLCAWDSARYVHGEFLGLGVASRALRQRRACLDYVALSNEEFITVVWPVIDEQGPPSACTVKG